MANTEDLKSFRTPSWEQLPDIDLYMDQVIGFIERYFCFFSSDDENDTFITSSMINNYVKIKLVAPPQKKKYNTEQIASFIMICVLKKIMSISQINRIFIEIKKSLSIKEIYDIFCSELDCAVDFVLSGSVPPSMNLNEGEMICAMKCGIRAFANVVYAGCVIAAFDEEEKLAKEQEMKKS